MPILVKKSNKYFDIKKLKNPSIKSIKGFAKEKEIPKEKLSITRAKIGAKYLLSKILSICFVVFS